MASVHDRMLEDLKLKNYSLGTTMQYSRCARKFLSAIKCPPTKASERAIRGYVLEMAKESAPSTVRMHVAAIRFLYKVTLRRPKLVESLHFPKAPQRLPDIDSQRGVIHIRDGKRARDRYVMLSPVLLTALREYWKMQRPTPPILFPGDSPGSFVSPEAIRNCLRKACRELGMTKRVTPHSLRHAFATHLLEDGADIRTIQALLGHGSIRSTARYTQLSVAHICKTTSPLDRLPRWGRNKVR